MQSTCASVQCLLILVVTPNVQVQRNAPNIREPTVGETRFTRFPHTWNLCRPIRPPLNHKPMALFRPMSQPQLSSRGVEVLQRRVTGSSVERSSPQDEKVHSENGGAQEWGFGSSHPCHLLFPREFVAEFSFCFTTATVSSRMSPVFVRVLLTMF